VAIAITFTPKSMTAAQFDEVHRKLAAAGAATPAGRTYHLCFGSDNRMRVLDVWETLEQFQKFGETLMPILTQMGIDPGTPDIQPLYHVRNG